MQSKEKILMGSVIVLMAVMLALKLNSGNKAASISATAAPSVQPVQDAGVALPQDAEALRALSVSQADTEMARTEKAPAPQGEVPKVETEPNITGMSRMSHDKCVATYKKWPRAVAFYSQSLGGDSALDYAICHAMTDSDDSACAFALGNQQGCMRAVLNYRTLSSAAKGKIDMDACMRFFTESGAGPKGMPPERVCRGIADIMTGHAEPPAEASEEFRFRSGSASSCSGLGDYARRDCLLLADMVAGMKHGNGRLWLNDVVNGKGCTKADSELVETYCSNRMTAGEKRREDGKLPEGASRMKKTAE